VAVATRRVERGGGPGWLLVTLPIALLGALLLGAAVGAGVGPLYLVAALVLPFALLLTLARPDWAVTAYVVLVYADLLSVLVKEHGLPPLARFAGLLLLAVVLGHRLVVHREGLWGDPILGWMAAYGVVVAIGFFYARQPDLILTNLVELARNFILVVIVINTLTTVGRIRRTLWALLAAGVVLASLTLVQMATGLYESDFGGLAVFRASEIVGGEDAPRPGGTIGDANYYGQSLLILVPIALYLLTAGRNLAARFGGTIAALILMGAIIVTYSRGDAVALAAILGAALLYKRPKLPYLLVGGVALLLMLPLVPANYYARLATLADVLRGDRQTLYTEESIRGRAGATQAAVDMFLDHPLVGVGREHYPLYQLEYLSGSSLAYRARGIPPHNLYLEVAAEHGLLGIFVMGGVLVVTWRSLFDARKRFLRAGDRSSADLAGWLAIGLFGYLVSALSLHGAFPAYLWLQVALIVALRQVALHASPDVVLPQLPELTPIPTTRPVPAPPSGERPERGSLGARVATRLEETREAVRPAPVNTEASRHNFWLDAAEAARRRGDTMTARSLVEAVLERDPQNKRARASLGRLETARELFTTSPRLTSAMIREEAPRVPAHPVASIFGDFWAWHGGEATFGQPVSPLFIEAATEGQPQQVQYFRRVRLEASLSAGGSSAVRIGKLGLEAPQMGRIASPLPEGLRGRQEVIGPDRHPVPWKFAVYWQLNGGPHLLGLPVSPVMIEELPGEETLIVQYFEQARLEYHPEFAGTPDEVCQTDLGSLAFRLRYGGPI
jgi:putative inorganic carbon (hco3(-)) transporter